MSFERIYTILEEFGIELKRIYYKRKYPKMYEGQDLYAPEPIFNQLVPGKIYKILVAPQGKYIQAIFTGEHALDEDRGPNVLNRREFLTADADIRLVWHDEIYEFDDDSGR